jgi:DNA-binding MarR family transcriptional regulator
MPLFSALSYLAAAHRANADAEVSGPELQRALGLSAGAVRALVAEFARQGLVEWDPLLTNIWIRITDKGLAAVEEAESRAGKNDDHS